MRALAEVFAGTLIAVGVITLLGSWSMCSLRPGLGHDLFWIGFVLILIGWLIGRSAARKTCPQKGEMAPDPIFLTCDEVCGSLLLRPCSKMLNSLRKSRTCCEISRNSNRIGLKCLLTFETIFNV